MKKKVLLLLVVFTVSFGAFSACKSSGNETVKMDLQADSISISKESPTESDPQAAAEAIFIALEDNGISADEKELTESEFSDLTGITNDDALEILAYRSEPKDGLVNIFIVKPYPSLREGVRSKLMTYKETCIREYEGFDILDSYKIAKNAVVIDQGEYLVMLMVKDASVAQVELDTYIAQ